MRSDVRLADLEWKESFAEYKPFEKMKIRLKKEIVRMGVDDLDINERGTYVEPEEWDDIISDPEVVVVDTRNDYEISLGHFKGAVNPHTHEFRTFPKWARDNLDPVRNRKVAMYCTGGIRCEKSTALLKQAGFEEVYHLKGGILQYLEDTKNKNGMWEGSCFVFDERIAVNEMLEPEEIHLCKKCSKKVTIDEIKASAARGPLCESCM